MFAKVISINLLADTFRDNYLQTNEDEPKRR
jgi:hypothetical protein